MSVSSVASLLSLCDPSFSWLPGQARLPGWQAAEVHDAVPIPAPASYKEDCLEAGHSVARFAQTEHSHSCRDKDS